ncbi:MAG: hypothetical protein GEU98_24505, partial [Pseudonocardiaceae bacterium]|nr:hypothetical protein [Pseudonocardiaceae bacterium]
MEQRCEGNPFFALELLRLTRDPAGVDRALPAGVREAIERRLDTVSPPTRRILCEAAVLGREFDAGRVAEIGERPVSTALDLLEEAIARELVVGDGGRRFRFAHVLTQEVAYAELTATDRYRLHARTAAAIGADEFAVDSLAHHLRQCADLGSVRPALDATLRAAAQARNQLAYEHAAFQFRQALELLPLVADPPMSRQELLLDMARCEFRSGTVADAWRSCREAADLGRAAGDGRTVADAATVIRGITMAHADPLCEQIHALCRSALMLLGDTDPVREAKVLAQLAITANVFAGDGTARHSQRALRLAEVTAETDARFMAMQARQVELVNPRHVLERLAIGERAVQLGEETGRDEYLAWGHVWRIDAFWELGRRSQLDQEVAKYTNLVAEMKEPLGMWRLRMIQACLAEMAGRFDAARDLADEALVIGQRGGHQGADFIHLVVRSRLARLTGAGAEESETAVRQFAEGGPRLARGWHAVQLIAAGRRWEAAEALKAVAPHIASVPPNAPEWLAARTGIASACAELGVRETAPQVYADLLPFADRMIVAGAHTGTEGPVAYYLGRLAQLLGKHGSAVTHLMSSLDSCVVMGSPPYEALTRAELGRVLLSRRGTGDLAVAERELGTALDIARRLGMRPLETEVSELLAPGRGGRASL